MTDDVYEKRVSCIRHVTNITQLLQGKWTLQILCTMRVSPVRLSQLTRLIPEASKKGLRANLRALESAKVVVRRDLSTKLLHVEYDFPEEMRESIGALVDNLDQWGRALEAAKENSSYPK